MERIKAGKIGRQKLQDMAILKFPFGTLDVRGPQLLTDHQIGSGVDIHVQVPEMKQMVLLSKASPTGRGDWRTQRKSKSMNLEAILQLPTKTLERNLRRIGQDLSNAFSNLREQQSSPSQVLKLTVYLCMKKYFVMPKSVEESALIIRNFHKDEFLLKAVSVELPDKSAVYFPCNSCVYNTNHYDTDRVFFSTKMHLPQDTPTGLKKLRNQELINMRGNGSGLRKEADRIYDYAVYNDLGDSDQHESLERPVLGGNDEFPYPKRIRTGRPEIDPMAEHRGEMYAKFYIPRDERVTLVHTPGLVQKDAIEEASRKMMPALYALYSTQVEFQSLDQVFDLFKKGGSMSSADSKCAPKCAPSEAEAVIKLRPPKVIAASENAWMLDEEFARQVLAGVNPVAIERVREFPIRSALDTTSYGSSLSAITASHIEPYLEGLDLQTTIAEQKLFILDYHDLYLPFVDKINQCPTSKAYATRTLFYLRRDGTLIPIAIELSLPPCEGENQSSMNRVVTPPPLNTKNWTWELAKTHVMSNDAGYHQLISHWLRSHATMEPVIIATHRQLSSLHPVHQALVPHFKNTMDINAAARKALVNAGGIIEKTFTPHEISMQMSSTWYKHFWRFDEQALPADLLKRGMAIPDDSKEQGIRLTIEDYPFAADGLELWGAIQTWLSDYVEVFYKDNTSVRNDEELRKWWTEIRTVGHGDKKDADGWPLLDSKRSLVHILNIIMWIASCYHAAVNFGQYEYAGFMPNHPTMTRKLIPDEGTAEFEEFRNDPESFYMSMISNETQAAVIAITTEALSTHAIHEEYLGQGPSPNWTSEDRVLAAFSRFQKRVRKIEKMIAKRNQEKRLKHRHGPAQVPYELLHPSSEPGLTGKGVPNSTSI
uniref:Lipoxygenase domain-containing protein n=1 Tax=Physcomitrium patens TaxID=3218 RepID=A0A2K1KD67_PHYPA|nr:linoleate 9S-lipoxygenase-like [Physcomitrium patens]PNR51725.1 hypothetical protein PHYPA_010913 [Physcomitrium patens]|eukprot:XP_024380206.1 linoleate 9S-lipoxygenase-like [Physcomitrella patens]